MSVEALTMRERRTGEMAEDPPSEDPEGARAAVPRMMLVRRDVYRRAVEEARRRGASPHDVLNAALAVGLEALEGDGEG